MNERTMPLLKPIFIAKHKTVIKENVAEYQKI
jgi:hypothetical protein